ncbi:MAG: hypothetical protein ILP11_03825 [Alphaproteobacteria bacterium]|nr:hypothetical protein [Alphaproteobacteria bacterium]
MATKEYTKEEIQTALNKLNWQEPTHFRNNQKQPDGSYLLFRVHGIWNDEATTRLPKGVVHLTPIFDLAVFPRQNLSECHLNFPTKTRLMLLSVYKGSPDNIFYGDSQLANSTNGASIGQITAFNKRDHYETNKLPENVKIATYITEGMGSLLRIALVSPELEDMIKTNERPYSPQQLQKRYGEEYE